MNSTESLNLPYIAAAQSQKHVTHNEALRMLDVVVQLSVRSRVANIPPAQSDDGDCYIVADNPTGAWSGHGGEVAAWQDGAWAFQTPQDGWRTWVEDEAALLVWHNSAWIGVTGSGSGSGPIDQLGINTTPDTTNRLSIKSDAALFSHDDVTPGTGDMRQVLNKATVGNTASQVYQTGFSARAEIGLAGDDDLQIKVSPDGTTFHEGLRIDRTTGRVTFPSNARVPNEDYGDGDIVNVDYVASRGHGVVTNGTGLLQNSTNFSLLGFDAVVSPNLPGSFSHSGYFSGIPTSDEFIALDPNTTYKLSATMRQQAASGDWSGFANGDRHRQYVGLVFFDIDQQPISPINHARFRSGGVDSYTVLTQPLTPGDTIVHVDNAAGWNTSTSTASSRGITIFAYRNTLGLTYDYYSRHTASPLFSTSGVDKVNNRITLDAPLPATLANHDHPQGTWPVGTRLANSMSGGAYKYIAANAIVLPQSERWYRYAGHIGGVDTSGTNKGDNFPPGTAFAKIVFLPNYSNRSGGFSGFPDTGATQKIWFAGLDLERVPLATIQKNANGSNALYAPHAAPGDTTITYGAPVNTVAEEV